MRGVPNGEDALGARVRVGGVRAVAAVCGRSPAGWTHPRPLYLVFTSDLFFSLVWALEQAVGPRAGSGPSSSQRRPETLSPRPWTLDPRA